MEPVVEHLREFYRVYVFVAVITVPIVIVFRRYTVPAIAYAFELCVYAAIVHGLFHATLRLAAWFKDQSSMKRAFGDVAPGAEDPGWTTPLLEFWKRGEYSPEWILYVEAVLLVGVIYLIWRYKPLRPQKKGRKPPPAKKGAQSSWERRKAEALKTKGKLK